MTVIEWAESQGTHFYDNTDSHGNPYNRSQTVSEPSEEAFRCVDNIMCALQLRLSDENREVAALNVQASIERAIERHDADMAHDPDERDE